MAYTTEAKIEALMGETFDSDSRPSSTEITTIITWSDAMVDAENTNVSGVQQELLSTLMAAHIIEAKEYTNMRVGDVSLRPMSGDSKYLQTYKMLAGKKRSTLFKVAND
ncbi:MAG: hypothetical protein JRI45_10230 [Deltaproteobacteria bacterium]|nr:hypothetical protein [Deltaproteobacteria bacterium]